jgi:hypothetical protein
MAVVCIVRASDKATPAVLLLTTTGEGIVLHVARAEVSVMGNFSPSIIHYTLAMQLISLSEETTSN